MGDEDMSHSALIGGIGPPPSMSILYTPLGRPSLPRVLHEVSGTSISYKNI